MVIFKKYEIPFFFKVVKFNSFKKKSFFVNCDYINSPIHSSLLFLSKNLFFLNIFINKNAFKKYLIFNISYINYFNLKSIQKIIFNN